MSFQHKRICNVIDACLGILTESTGEIEVLLAAYIHALTVKNGHGSAYVGHVLFNYK